MNSTVEPIFNEKVAKKWGLWVPWTVHRTHWYVEKGGKSQTLRLLLMNSSCNIWLFGTSVGPVHYSRDPQISLFSNFFIKNRSHGTIHIFKIYFATVFSIFNFHLYPNGPVNLKMTKTPLKPIKWLKYPRNLKDVQNTPET